MSRPQFVSPIAIDLGARHTGLFLATYHYGELPEHGIGTTIHLPEEGGKMTWSQQGRTQVRHRIRSNKRRKYAKRLLKLALLAQNKQHGITLTDKQWSDFWESARGLMNRRGYNRIEADIDLEALVTAEPSYVADKIPHFNPVDSLAEQFETLSQDMTLVRELNNDSFLNKPARDIQREFADLDAAEKKLATSAIKTLKEAVSNIINQRDYGHQHRREYLQAIRAEIVRDSRLAPVRDVVGTDRIWRVIGNISNLQLRSTRWYFNHKSMREADFWDSDRLRVTILRWLRYWRPGNEEERARQKEALRFVEGGSDIIEVISTLDPNLTIPPYEDQDNRRPPKDQTLLLNPAALSRAYGEHWIVWAKKLHRHNADWGEGIKEILANYDRKSRLPQYHNGKRIEPEQSADAYYYCYFLQRILDRNRRLDPYALRLLSRGKETQTATEARQTLEDHLGSQHIDSFLRFCNSYYSEVEQARQGLWLVRDSALLERSGLNPPHKNKIMHQLIGSILGERLSAEKLEKFREELWVKRVKGNSTLRGLCKNIEETRKDHGNLFNARLGRLQYRIEIKGEKEKDVLKSPDDKKIWKDYLGAKAAQHSIGEYLGHSEPQRVRYANSFSMAQLFNLLESDPRGFSSTTLAVTMEQAWRMGEVLLDGRRYARCSRLPADSVRPFDGVLRRVLEQQAHAIARKKIEELSVSDLKDCQLDLPLLIEENRFAFTESLLDLKRASAAKRRLFDERLQQQSDRWISKDERIKTASKDVCPYTGNHIGSKGEIDHILPQSASRDRNGTVFNSEANLIWCSRDGNQRKSNQAYLLADLNAGYLKQLYGTSDTAAIRERIEQSISELDENFTFDALDEEKRRDVRHSLFLPSDSPARQKVQRLLSSQGTARVNGTQAWLARRIIELLEKHLSKWAESRGVEIRYHAARVNAEDVSRIRRMLAHVEPELGKQAQQGIASHAIDAVCVFAQATATPRLMDMLGLGPVLSEEMGPLLATIPQQISVERIERRNRIHKSDIASQPIFKEGIYGEDFLPVWVFKGRILIGFDAYGETAEVQGEKSNEFLDVLSDFFDQPLPDSLDQGQPCRLCINKNKAFRHLDSVWREPADEHFLLQADLLDALRYSTAKKDIEAVIYDAQKKTFKSEAEILKLKDFQISVKVNVRGRFKFSGKITLPTINDWKKLIRIAELAPLIGEKVAEPVDFRSILTAHFNAGSKRSHAKTRRNFSLPRVDGPSGGFRIRRSNPEGEAVWQLYGIEGTSAKGFAVEDGKIDWKNPVPLDQLKDSRNVTPLDGRWQKEPDDVVLFDEWRTVKVEGVPTVISASIAPGTQARAYIRLTQERSQFLLWMTACTDQEWKNIYKLPSELKVDAKRFLELHGTPLLGEPRGNLFLEQLGETVTYLYCATGTNAAMKQAYQTAYSAHR